MSAMFFITIFGLQELLGISASWMPWWSSSFLKVLYTPKWPSNSRLIWKIIFAMGFCSFPLNFQTNPNGNTNLLRNLQRVHASLRCQLGVLWTATKHSYKTFQLCSVSPQVPRLRKCSTSPHRKECFERPAPHRSWCFLRSPPLRGPWSEG